ncbi:MAG TPA: TetR family transcriptional regulator C-terminal domain-containing protein [Mycobacteriales bacterium]|nr:TetR family transcriptional regulator C-terminal domain-containing protein [Mycobacteriales bacterium]
MTAQPVQPADSASSDGRREQLLDAALAVIAERGFPETRIADVAAYAGTSPALVIYYFKTRDQLLTEAIRLNEDRWYAEGTARIATIESAAGRLEELVAMSCLPEVEGEDRVSWVIWLDLWAQAARHPEVAKVRQEFDDHWRRTITDLVIDGQQRGEFASVDPADFAIALSAMIDGFAVQAALADPVVDETRAFRLVMTFAAAQLGFRWSHRRRRQPASAPASRPRSSRRTAKK